eukprot:UN01152
MFKNYGYDGSLKPKTADNRANNASNVSTDFDAVLQNNENILKTDPDIRHSQGIHLGDPDSADLRIVALGHARSGNSSLMLRLFYNEYDDKPEDNKLLQWEQHQMNYKYSNKDTLRISYFDLKGFDDILSQSEMSNRIGNVINHGCNVILLYYSITNKLSFEDDIDNGYSVQNIKEYVEYYLNLIDHKKFITILIGLQSDAKNKRQISVTQGENLAKKWGNIPFIEVSAKTNKNVEKLLKMMCQIYTNEYGLIDGDLNEAAAFDEDKALEKSIIKENDDYEDEYPSKTGPKERFKFNTFDIIITDYIHASDDDYDYNRNNTTRINEDESSQDSFPYHDGNSDSGKEIKNKPLDDKKFLAHIKKKKKKKVVPPPPESDDSDGRSDEESSEAPIYYNDEKETEDKTLNDKKNTRSVFIKKKKNNKPITITPSQSASDDSDEASNGEHYTEPVPDFDVESDEDSPPIPENPKEETKKRRSPKKTEEKKRRLPKKQADKTPIVSTYVEPLKDKPLEY